MSRWNLKYRQLGSWVTNQRTNRNKLGEDRIGRLSEIGFIWVRHETAWEMMFNALVDFKRKHEHCNVRSGNAQYRQLAIWVSGQRSNRCRLSGERVRRLEEIGFVWDPFDSAWEKMFVALLDFHRRHGHCTVARNWHRNPALSRWVLRQRQDKKKGQLAAERIERLRALGFLWNTRQTAWERMLLKLKEFNREQGHCNVSPRDPNAYELGRWVAKQRARRGKLSDEEAGLYWCPAVLGRNADGC